ncbi:molybdopterin-synthase adenylyltransferase MoeB [Pedobacter sp. PWIIR3]
MDSERYNRQIILKGFGIEAQTKLNAASVLVIGAGGLGCPALQYLTAAGIGRIGIVDDDQVSLSNLQRQVLYDSNDIGKLKATTAARKLKDLNPDINIIAYSQRIQRHNILELVRQYDYVLDGTDNFESRYLINDACHVMQKPVVFGAVSGFEGQIAIFNVGNDEFPGANYRDIFPVQPSQNEIPNCEENGVIGVLPGIIGTMQAAEVIKLITKIGTPLINKLLNYNLLTQMFYEISISAAPENYTIPKNEAEFLNTTDEGVEAGTDLHFIDIDGEELLSILNKRSTILIDVRERHEYPKLNSPLIRQVPVSELPEFMNGDIKAQNIVLICQHGIRSEAAAEAMKEKFGIDKNIFNLKGGVSRWRKHLTALL